MSEEKVSTTQDLKVQKQTKRDRRYLINIIVILLITFGYTTYSLWNELPAVINVFRGTEADYRMIIIIIGLIALKFFIEGIILFIFARLYTPTYKIHRGVANAFIGQFYNDITPSATGGQFAQVKTFAQQGVPVSIGASIMVMHFILYQIVLVVFGGLLILLNLGEFARLGSVSIFKLNIPVWVFASFGFLANLVTIVGLFLLAYSRRVHHFVINVVVDLLAKIKIVKRPEYRKNKLYTSTENFRIELRRLSSNVPASILIMVLFFLKFIVNYSVTYFVALMLNPALYGGLSFWETISKTGFLGMITGFIPIPGAAGFAEYFYEIIFSPVFGGDAAFTKAVQLIWRVATFYVNLIVGGFVTAFYRSSMEEIVDETGHVKTFEEVKSYTFAERRETSVTMYATSQLSIKEIQRRLSPKKKRRWRNHKEDQE
jgi:uncharacterized membrane protein YbhN (UPF0104 family)